MKVNALKGWRGVIKDHREADILHNNPLKDDFPDAVPPGLHGIWLTSNEIYHAGPGVSKSDLDLIEKAPLLYSLKKAKGGKAPTASMALGTAVHTLVLEPENWDKEFVVNPNIERRSNAGKEAYAKFMADNAGKTVIDQDDADKARAMADAVLSHPTAGPMFKGGAAELSFFSKRPNVTVKCRPDYLRKGEKDGHLAIIDLKTSASAAPGTWKWSARDYRYHVQAAMYSDLVHEVTGMPVERFLFVVVESVAPFLVAVYEFSEENIQEGRKKYRDNLATLAICETRNEWPGYPTAITPISL